MYRRDMLNKYYFRPNLEIVKRIYLENAGRDYEVSDKIFNATLIVEAEDEDICQSIRGGFTDITQWEMFDPDSGETIPHNLKNPEPWQT